ncbi:hypothetical protein GOBAR_AA08851 [Gossypium barbadense]|uniref:alpha-1,2-Mannosidase n=1 Tax=Gossypium barbadense TaxID=3634 RepID=A0A2P5Y871_GOSBA|nr:hypothetical protein GOBAR_AA08851 [Gossypium barbadense]
MKIDMGQNLIGFPVMWVANSLDFNKDYDASVFETTIRVVGGLLSAYDLSRDNVFLEKARDIADRLLPAWDTTTGIPYNVINLARGNAHNPGWAGGILATYNGWERLERWGGGVGEEGQSILADSGTEQLEFIALSQRTGDPKYQDKVEKVIVALNKTFPADGLLPIYINPDTATGSYSTITFGAMGDSFYEYLLKAWIQGNKTSSLKLYMDELACFAPGMLALGSSGYGPDEAKKFLSLAEELAWTCYSFYQSTPTKLAGENYFFNPGQDMTVGTSWNILRPETVESLFYLWRLTGNKTYQEWGWNIFQAFEKNSRIESGYVGLKDLSDKRTPLGNVGCRDMWETSMKGLLSLIRRSTPSSFAYICEKNGDSLTDKVNTGIKDNKMQSFFLAEMLKYLYLLFSPPTVIPLDEWVFNTEAHPLRIVNRNDANLAALEGQHKPVIKIRSRKTGRLGDDKPDVIMISFLEMDRRVSLQFLTEKRAARPNPSFQFYISTIGYPKPIGSFFILFFPVLFGP